MSTSLAERRYRFISYLIGLHNGATSGVPRHQSECRQALARLRRSLSGPQQAEAYEIVFRQNPPESEQEIWLLVAGLFALHPQSRRHGNRTIGTSMRALHKQRGESATRRFEQLLARDRNTLPHHIRQTVRLLAADDIPINFGQLLDDLAELLGDNYREEPAQRVRLRWARDFHRTEQTKTTDNNAESPETQ